MLPQPASPNSAPVMTVGEFTKRLEQWFDKQPILRDIAISGEISNFSAQPNGAVYFSLKDDHGLLRCYAFANRAKIFPPLQEGSAVVARGAVSVRGLRSEYQLLVSEVQLTGIGQLYVQQERLREKFEAEGLFSATRKRPLPRHPFGVALVSRHGGDGEIDFRREIARAPHANVITVDTPVQGIAAGPEIADAIDRANTLPVDIIALVRGGGSFEDLFVFSTEPVIRAIVRSRIPIITGVGHHAHRMLCDLVADRAYGTPSAAAGLFVEGRRDTLATIRGYESELQNYISRSMATLIQRRDAGHRALCTQAAETIHARRDGLRMLEKRLNALAPFRELARRKDLATRAVTRLSGLRAHLFNDDMSQLERLRDKLLRSARQGLTQSQTNYRVTLARLLGTNPSAILDQGYAIVRKGGRAIRDAVTLSVGDLIDTQLARGTFASRVESTTDAG